MRETLLQTIDSANSRVVELLLEAQSALRGEREFTPKEVHALSEVLEKMAGIAAGSADLRIAHPEISGPLEAYKSVLRELQTTLQQIRVMLLSRQTEVTASQNHVTAVTRWLSALHQTR